MPKEDDREKVMCNCSRFVIYPGYASSSVQKMSYLLFFFTCLTEWGTYYFQ